MLVAAAAVVVRQSKGGDGGDGSGGCGGAGGGGDGGGGNRANKSSRHTYSLAAAGRCPITATTDASSTRWKPTATNWMVVSQALVGGLSAVNTKGLRAAAALVRHSR